MNGWSYTYLTLGMASSLPAHYVTAPLVKTTVGKIRKEMKKSRPNAPWAVTWIKTVKQRNSKQRKRRYDEIEKKSLGYLHVNAAYTLVTCVQRLNTKLNTILNHFWNAFRPKRVSLLNRFRPKHVPKRVQAENNFDWQRRRRETLKRGDWCCFFLAVSRVTSIISYDYETLVSTTRPPLFSVFFSRCKFHITLCWLETNPPSVLWRCWLGDKKGFGPQTNLCHLSPEVLFRTRGRRQWWGNRIIQVHLENGGKK